MRYTPNKFQQAFLLLVESSLEFLASNAMQLKSAGLSSYDYKMLRVQSHRRAGHTIAALMLADSTTLPILFIVPSTPLQQHLEQELVKHVYDTAHIKIVNIATTRHDPSAFFTRHDPPKWKFVIVDNIVLLNGYDSKMRSNYTDLRDYLLPKTDLFIELQ
jgi:acetolactate synthase regulatory subunit